MMAGDGAQGGRIGAGGDLVDDLGAQQAGGAVLHFGELGADASLEREAAQQAGAEGVDRLDLQPARRFDGAGEEAARIAQGGTVDG